MTVDAKLLNLERLQKKMLALISASSQAKIKAANQKSADEFQAVVTRAVPQDPNAKHEHLVASLAQSAVGTLGVGVSIGNEATPYPLHLETGHRARDGSHVAARAFWFPSKRVVKKRAENRLLRAERAAVRAICAGGG